MWKKVVMVWDILPKWNVNQRLLNLHWISDKNDITCYANVTFTFCCMLKYTITLLGYELVSFQPVSCEWLCHRPANLSQGRISDDSRNLFYFLIKTSHRCCVCSESAVRKASCTNQQYWGLNFHRCIVDNLDKTWSVHFFFMLLVEMMEKVRAFV